MSRKSAYPVNEWLHGVKWREGWHLATWDLARIHWRSSGQRISVAVGHTRWATTQTRGNEQQTTRSIKPLGNLNSLHPTLTATRAQQLHMRTRWCNDSIAKEKCSILIKATIKNWMPSAEIIYPRYSIDESMKTHSLFFSRSPASSSLLKTSSSSWRCSSTVVPVRRISSKYTETWSNPCRMHRHKHRHVHTCTHTTCRLHLWQSVDLSSKLLFVLSD